MGSGQASHVARTPSFQAWPNIDLGIVQTGSSLGVHVSDSGMHKQTNRIAFKCVAFNLYVR